MSDDLVAALASIIERDAEWIEQDDRLVYTWRSIHSGEMKVAPHATDPDGPADRRALLALLRGAREAIACEPVLTAEQRALLDRLAPLRSES